MFQTVGEAVDLVRGFREQLRKFNLRIGWPKSGVMASDNRIVKQIRGAINALYQDVSLPDVQKGYKYLGCHIVWRQLPTFREIQEAADKVKKKVRNYSFRFGSLRNDLK